MVPLQLNSYGLSRYGRADMFGLMADTLESAAPIRRRRADARRSIDAIVGAARTVLGERPDASMEDIAAAAGVSRQTVYAHFPSRDALILALIDAAGAETLAAIDAARLDSAPPAEALARFLGMCWQLLDRFPVLLDPALIRLPRPAGPDPHDAATAMLERLIRRGQWTGAFDRALDASWLAAATVGLIHTAAGQVAAGRLTADAAAGMLLESTLRMCGVDDEK